MYTQDAYGLPMEVRTTERIVPEAPEPWEILGFRRFTKVDWYGMAGAESFLDGSDPLIFYGPEDADGFGWYAIIDASGIHAERYDPVGTASEGAWIGEDRRYDAHDWLKEWAGRGTPITFESIWADPRASKY